MKRWKNILAVGLAISMLGSVSVASINADTGNGIEYDESLFDIDEKGVLISYKGKENLDNIVIPEGVTAIGDEAFYKSSILSLTIPEGVKSIGKAAFKTCGSIPESMGVISFPESLVSIGDEAFNGLAGITGVKIPKNVNYIGENVFRCSYLKSIEVDEENTTYDSRNGCNAIIETKTNKLIAGCKETVVPKDITCIGRYAFAGQDKLEKLELPEGVTEIDDFAFSGCYNITEINIPKSVTNIGARAFSGCSKLTNDHIILSEGLINIGNAAFAGCNITSISIPSSVTSVGRGAFVRCKNLENVTVSGVATIIGENAFEECEKLKAITGYTGSYAETYAKQNGYEFISLGVAESTVSPTPGIPSESQKPENTPSGSDTPSQIVKDKSFYDIDGTEGINLSDALVVLKCALGITQSEEEYNLSDALMCLKIALGIVVLE